MNKILGLFGTNFENLSENFGLIISKIQLLSRYFITMLSKFSIKFFGNSKKRKLKKGTENLEEVLGKFYFKVDKILSKICEIFE